MDRKKKAYEHSGEVTGFGSHNEPSAETEHREETAPSAEERNELAPDARAHPDRYGPRTRQDTRITRKDEAEDE